MVTNKIALYVGVLALAGWGNMSRAEGPATDSYVPSEDVVVDMLDEYTTRPELDGIYQVDESSTDDEAGLTASTDDLLAARRPRRDHRDDRMHRPDRGGDRIRWNNRWFQRHGDRWWDGYRWHSRHWDGRRWVFRVIVPIGPRPGDRNVCFAQNGRGQIFRATGWELPRRVQRDAMQSCRHNSRNPGSCRALGCRR